MFYFLFITNNNTGDLWDTIGLVPDYVLCIAFGHILLAIWGDELTMKALAYFFIARPIVHMFFRIVKHFDNDLYEMLFRSDIVSLTIGGGVFVWFLIEILRTVWITRKTGFRM